MPESVKPHHQEKVFREKPPQLIFDVLDGLGPGLGALQFFGHERKLRRHRFKRAGNFLADEREFCPRLVLAVSELFGVHGPGFSHRTGLNGRCHHVVAERFKAFKGGAYLLNDTGLHLHTVQSREVLFEVLHLLFHLNDEKAPQPRAVRGLCLQRIIEDFQGARVSPVD